VKVIFYRESKKVDTALTSVKNNFKGTLSRNFAIKQSLQIASHLKHVAAYTTLSNIRPNIRKLACPAGPCTLGDTTYGRQQQLP